MSFPSRSHRAVHTELPPICTQSNRPPLVPQYAIPPPPPPRPRSVEHAPALPPKPPRRPTSLQQPHQCDQHQYSCPPSLSPPLPPLPPKQPPCQQQSVHRHLQVLPPVQQQHPYLQSRQQICSSALPKLPQQLRPPAPPKPPQYCEAAQPPGNTLPQIARRTVSGPARRTSFDPAQCSASPPFQQPQGYPTREIIPISDVERPIPSTSRRTALQRPQLAVVPPNPQQLPIHQDPGEKRLPTPLRISRPKNSLTRGTVSAKRNRQTMPARPMQSRYVAPNPRASEYLAFHPAHKSNINEIAALLQAEIDDIGRQASADESESESGSEAEGIDDMERQFLGPAMLQNVCTFMPAIARRSVSTPVEMPGTPIRGMYTPVHLPASEQEELPAPQVLASRPLAMPRASTFFAREVQPAKAKIHLPKIITNTVATTAHSAAFHRAQSAQRTPSPSPSPASLPSPGLILPPTPTSPTLTTTTTAEIKPGELDLFNEIRRMLTFKEKIVRDQDEDEDEEEYTDEFDEVLEVYTGDVRGGNEVGVVRIGTVRR